MAKKNNSATLQSNDVPDEVVSQVGKAVSEILKLRQSLEDDMATARTDEEREALAGQVESAAVQAIGDQGLTVDQYNQVIASAQADEDLEQRVLLACRAA